MSTGFCWGSSFVGPLDVTHAADESAMLDLLRDGAWSVGQAEALMGSAWRHAIAALFADEEAEALHSAMIATAYVRALGRHEASRRFFALVEAAWDSIPVEVRERVL